MDSGLTPLTSVDQKTGQRRKGLLFAKTSRIPLGESLTFPFRSTKSDRSSFGAVRTNVSAGVRTRRYLGGKYDEAAPLPRVSALPDALPSRRSV